jgi:hypothetical protein
LLYLFGLIPQKEINQTLFEIKQGLFVVNQSLFVVKACFILINQALIPERYASFASNHVHLLGRKMYIFYFNKF